MAVPFIPLLTVAGVTFSDELLKLLGRASPGAEAYLRTGIDDWVKGPVRAWISAGINDARSLGLSDEEARRLSEQVTSAGGLLGVAVGLYAGLKLIGIRVNAWTNALSIVAQRRVADATRFQLPDQASVLRFLELFPERGREVEQYLDELGLTNEAQQMLLEARQATPDLVAIYTLRNRELIDDRQALEMLAQSGYRGDDPARLLELRHWLPSPQDLVSLAGREAFEPDAIERFKLDADYPAILDEHGKRSGISPDWMRKFWVAHWLNPSLEQVFRMVHRKVKKPDGTTFGLDDLDVFYRLADVNPFFGDLLRQIAFLPIGRIDIRRFRRAGLIEYDEVQRRYEDLGYSPDDARVLADFAEHEATRAGRDLSRTQLQRLYRLGTLTGVEVEQRLEEIGYSAQEAAEIRLLLDTEIEADDTERRRAYVEYQFTRYQIDDAAARSMLAELGVSTAGVDIQLAEWTASRETGRALPSITVIASWYADKIIDRPEAERLLLLRRVDPGDVVRYLGDEAANPPPPGGTFGTAAA